MAKNAAGGAIIALAVIFGMFMPGKKDDPPKPEPTSYAVASWTTPAATSTASAPTSPPEVARTSVRAPSPPPATAYPRLIIRGHDVPMRAEPAPKARIVDKVPQGLAVEEVERADGWVKVRHPVTTAQGWVKASLTRAVGIEDQAKPEVAKTKPSVGPALATSVVKARIIAASRADYPGNCACPDDRDKRGHRCGGRSAYSRPGGYAPLCYPSDVSAEMVAEYRRTHAIAAQ